jgi:hypothetical protein
VDEILIQDPTLRINIQNNLTLEFSAKITPELKEKISANPIQKLPPNLPPD